MIRAEFAQSIAVAVVLLICLSGSIARAEDLSSTSLGENGISHNIGKGSPLLPCPRSVPCLPAADSEGGHPTSAVASAGLLPCPFSVPCFTTGQDIDVPITRKVAPTGSRARRPVARRSRSARATRINSRTKAAKIRTRIKFAASSGEALKPAHTRGRKTEMALGDDAAYQAQAQTLLTEVDRKLGGLDRTRLDANKSQVYAKASVFTTEGFKALHAHDNLAALGFAEKAQVLSADLGPPQSK